MSYKGYALLISIFFARPANVIPSFSHITFKISDALINSLHFIGDTEKYCIFAAVTSCRCYIGKFNILHFGVII